MHMLRTVHRGQQRHRHPGHFAAEVLPFRCAGEATAGMTSTAIIYAGVCLTDKKMAAGFFIADGRSGDESEWCNFIFDPGRHSGPNPLRSEGTTTPEMIHYSQLIEFLWDI